MLGHQLDANKEVAGEEYNTGAHKGPATRLEGGAMEAFVTERFEHLNYTFYEG